MEVFKRAIDSNGGNPLPLNLYLKPTMEGPPGETAASAPALSPTRTLINRVSFFEAILHDKYFPTVAAFLIGGMSPSVRREEDGATALHIAVSGTTALRGSPLDDVGPIKNIFDPPCPNQLIIAFLIDNGGDVDGENNRGETPLMTAVAAQNMRAVKLLLAKGADIQRRDSNGYSVLNYAATHPHIIQSLQIWVGSEELPRLARDEHLLHTVCSRPGTALSALFLIEQLQLDVNAPLGPHTRTRANEEGSAAKPGAGEDEGVEVVDGSTPLHYAVRTGDVELVKALLSRDADPMKPDAAVNGVTPLQLANSLRTRRTPRKAPSALVGTVVTDHAQVHATLKAFVASAPNSRAREAVLGESSTQIWVVNDLTAWIQCVAISIAPHVALFLACVMLDSFLLLTAVVVGLFFVMFRVRVTDENMASVPIVPTEQTSRVVQAVATSGSPRRPLRTFGLFVSFVLAFLWSLHVETTHYPAAAAAAASLSPSTAAMAAPIALNNTFSIRASLPDDAARQAFDEAQRLKWLHVKNVTAYFFLPSAMVAVGALLWMILKNPGTVASTAGQRRGIYASILRAKGVPSKELLYSTDLSLMVKKPLRAQHCPFIERVVLRYDHFSLHLATSIGARNYRAYVYGHIALDAWLISMAMISSTLTDILYSQSTNATQSLFSTPLLRMVYLYTRVVLPLFIFMAGFVVFEQVLTIRRNLSSFDISHATDDSSLYCFELGNGVYSVFDQGARENLKRFLLGKDELDAITYRVPQMSPYLASIVREHERWQLNESNQAECGSDEHGHSHGEGGDGHAHARDPTRSQLTLLTGSADAAEEIVTNAQPSFTAPASSKKQMEAESSPELQEGTSLAYGLFQELIRHGGDPELFRTTQRANRSGFSNTVNAELTPDDLKRQEEWDAAVAQAREMYRVFQENMNASMQRFMQEHAAADGGGHGHSHDGHDGHGHAHGDDNGGGGGVGGVDRPTVSIPVVEDTFASGCKHD